MSSSCVGLCNEPIYLPDMKHFRGDLGVIALLNKKTIGNASTDQLNSLRCGLTFCYPRHRRNIWILVMTAGESYPFKVYFYVTNPGFHFLR